MQELCNEETEAKEKTVRKEAGLMWEVRQEKVAMQEVRGGREGSATA